jgi:hypothetical protein
MRAATWIVQKRLHPTAGADTFQLISDACAEIGRPCIEINVADADPLAGLKPIKKPFIFYGYSTLINSALRSPQWNTGVFFDPELFKPSIYAAKYGTRYLNSDLRVTTVGQLLADTPNKDTEFFIRPNDDSKVITGQVLKLAELREQSDILLAQEVAASPPKKILSEWRVFLLEAKAIASTQYRPQAQKWVPREVVDFAEKMANKWNPVKVVVMDIADTRAGLRVIELNCFNGSSFYLADVDTIVRQVSHFIENRNQMG